MDEVSSKLTAIFQNVNEWLKFAEAKNGILLAFSGAGITAIITLLSTAQNLPQSLNFGLLLTTILLCICSLICSLSFLPKINLERLLWLQTKPPKSSNFIRKDTDNFYYFGHLQKYNSTELLDALNKHYFEGTINKPYKKEYEDIAGQITINSEIAFLKFQVFTYAIYILIASILVIPFSAIINLFIYKKL
ncbi:MAG: hypothetical protein V7L02_00450 [Nostoc sp.]|uniref:hypothetical protein n=1 Tax=Nostoc sp. TaxID=1180 RepID=UPI002FF71C35